MKSIYTTILLMVLAISLTAQESLPDQQTLGNRAKTLIEECVTFQETAGISAGIGLNGQLFWQDGAGYRDVAANVKAKADMIHRTASISKPMTAVAIMQLYEQGKLALDDPIRQYLPYFPEKKEGTITIRHLLTHSSGIRAYKSEKEGFNTKSYTTLKEAISVFQSRNLAHAPGSKYAYTTYGYVVLGAIIEQASGLSYRAYMKKHIWDPAGMTDTDVEIFGTGHERKSKLYVKNSSGEIVPDKQTDLSNKVPGGGIQSTVTDLIKFGHAILNNELVKPETLQMMITDSGIKKQGNPYGFGWFLYAKEDQPSGRIFGHSGSQSGTSTQLMIYPDRQMVVATLGNTRGTWTKILGLNYKLAQLVTDPKTLAAPSRKPILLPVADLNHYTGKYQTADGESVRIVRKGTALYLDPEDHNQQKMFAASKEMFFFRSNSLLETTLNFTGTENGDIAKVSFTNKDEVKVYHKLEGRSFAWALYNVMDEQGIKDANRWYKQNLGKQSWRLDVEEMKTAAYNLLTIGKIKEGLALLKLNVESFPGSEKSLDEATMNSVGYQLLNADAADLAIEFFNLNVTVFPASANAHDSLGEAYAKVGKTKLAIKSYEKSLELNPDNTQGKSMLLKLKGAK